VQVRSETYKQVSSKAFTQCSILFGRAFERFTQIAHVRRFLCRFLFSTELVLVFQRKHRIGKKLREACSEQPQSIDKIRSLVKDCPDAIKASTESGWLPLHIACSHKAPLEVIQYLVEQWPESVKKADNSGETALDIGDQAPEVIAWLQDADAGRIAFATMDTIKSDIASKLVMRDCSNSLVFHKLIANMRRFSIWFSFVDQNNSKSHAVNSRNKLMRSGLWSKLVQRLSRC
jgi:hypothetical protein